MTKRILCVLLAASLVGCRSSETSLTGTVTINDQPLRRGYVTFFPVEGTKGASGATVNDGQFTLKRIPPGRWKALVSETPDVSVVQNGIDPPTLTIAQSAISPETPGNQAIVEIRAGKQTLNFALKNP